MAARFSTTGRCCTQALPRPKTPMQVFKAGRSDSETLSDGELSDDVGSGLDDELPFLSPQQAHVRH